MATSLLTTKLYIPPLRPEMVSRPRLIERLNAGLHRKLTLVSAPAGFGKTTLLSEWAASCEWPVAWVSLEEGDNDLTRFLTYFVAALRYEHHIGMPYPTHAETNCESCHVEGAYNVPDQTKSLPGALSGSDSVEGWDRNIGDVPLYITGPAARACGGCHRAELINEDDASGLASFNQHTKQGGYLIEGGDDYTVILGKVIDAIMAIFK